MARYVNPEICARDYGVPLNCTIEYLDSQNKTVASLGSTFPGGFDGDPDIAGIGVLGAFVTVTICSVILSIGNTLWWISKNVLHWKSRLSVEEKSEKKWQISVSGFFETLVLTCSDQQIFTGGAYAITLRYAKACSISAYHYNIVTNMLLFTCATHLMAVTIAKHYWQHPYIAALRIGITALVYLITGLILSNQNSSGVNFPTRVPSPGDQYSTMLLSAACFQSGQAGLTRDIQNAFNAKDVSTFFSNQIPGFTQYLVMCMFYIIAVIVSIGRFVRRGADHDGRRKRFLEWFKRTFSILFRARRFFYLVFAIYLCAGVAIASWTVQGSFRYIYDLREWVRNSIWITRDMNERVNEDDPATFGQLVPLLLISLTVFSFLHLLAERLSVKKRRAKMLEEMEKKYHHPSDAQDGKPTQVHTGTGYFDQPPTLNLDKSTGFGFAVTDLGNMTPETPASNRATPPVYAQSFQTPQPPHLQSRTQTWSSNMTTGTTATQGSNRSVSYSRPHNGSQTSVAQNQQQQTPPPQSDVITPVSSVYVMQSPGHGQFQPAFTAPTAAGGYAVIYTAIPPASTANVVHTAPSGGIGAAATSGYSNGHMQRD
ncbi:hypothetical protein V8F33_004134 [Rhypophila sp. PSN 637]